MSSTAALQESKMDVFKLVIALVFVMGGMFAFYYFGEHSLLMRVLGLLVVIAFATGVALTTEPGHRLLGFFRESQIEVRKVVWPTIQETRQTTLVIVLFVVLIAIFLWLLDMFLGWLAQSLAG